MKKRIILLILFINIALPQEINDNELQIYKKRSVKIFKKTLQDIKKFKKDKEYSIDKLNSRIVILTERFNNYKIKEKKRIEKLKKELSKVKRELKSIKKNRDRSCNNCMAKLNFVKKQLLKKEIELKNKKEKERVTIKEDISTIIEPINQPIIEPIYMIDNSNKITTNEENLPIAINIALEKAMNNSLNNSIEIVIEE